MQGDLYVQVFTCYIQVVLCGLAIAEAAILIAQHSESASLIHRAIDALLSHARINPDTLHLGLTGTSLAGCLLGLSGGLIRVWCHRTLGRFFTWELSVKNDQRLITTGPYAIVRHPSYLGMFLGDIGIYLCHLGPGSWAREGGWLKTTSGKIAASVWMTYVLGVMVMRFV